MNKLCNLNNHCIHCSEDWRWQWQLYVQASQATEEKSQPSTSSRSSRMVGVGSSLGSRSPMGATHTIYTTFSPFHLKYYHLAPELWLMFLFYF